jgi:PTS system mannose-specific IIA component
LFSSPTGGLPLSFVPLLSTWSGPRRRYEIIEAVKRVDTGDGVVILTDMFGGTPSNLAISVMSRPKVEVLAGINLPMLVKLAKVRDDCPLPEAVAAAQEAGRKYVTIASRVLAGK